MTLLEKVVGDFSQKFSQRIRNNRQKLCLQPHHTHHMTKRNNANTLTNHADKHTETNLPPSEDTSDGTTAVAEGCNNLC